MESVFTWISLCVHVYFSVQIFFFVSDTSFQASVYFVIVAAVITWTSVAKDESMENSEVLTHLVNCFKEYAASNDRSGW